jgi:hypothetical protein
MSRATVKKMKVAAARRPGGGADGGVALAVRSGETSSGSVIRGSGVVMLGCGVWGDSAMRLMAVYVSFMGGYWIFRREFVACESCEAAIASVREVGWIQWSCVADVLYWVRDTPPDSVSILGDEG